MRTLILVDLQNDFCPGGNLEVPKGDEVIPVANKMIPYFDLIVASKDWHPANHLSFAANHPWRRPGQVIDLNGVQQILWPMHCVQDSFGAEFVHGLQTDKISKIVYKGTDPEIDSYSAFFDNARKRSTGLGEYLQEQNVEEIYLLGLATDYCVKFTVLDAIDLGFKVHLITDGCRGINLEDGDVAKALTEMKEKGASLIASDELTTQMTNHH